MLPFCVPEVMEKLEMLSLEIQRMPKEMGKEFGDLSKNPYLSVCTTSTHDMSTMRAWWEEDRARTHRYFNNELNQYGMAPLFCEPWICQQIIEKHMNCRHWVITSIQIGFHWREITGKEFSEDKHPPTEHYWDNRFTSIDELEKTKPQGATNRSIFAIRR